MDFNMSGSNSSCTKGDEESTQICKKPTQIPKVIYESRSQNDKNLKPMIDFLKSQHAKAIVQETIYKKSAIFCSTVDRFLAVSVVVISGVGSILFPILQNTNKERASMIASIILATTALITSISCALEYGKKSPLYSQIEQEYTKIVNLINISMVYLQTAEVNNEDVEFNVTGIIEEIQHTMETLQHIAINTPFFINKD